MAVDGKKQMAVDSYGPDRPMPVPGSRLGLATRGSADPTSGDVQREEGWRRIETREQGFERAPRLFMPGVGGPASESGTGSHVSTGRPSSHIKYQLPSRKPPLIHFTRCNAPSTVDLVDLAGTPPAVPPAPVPDS
jgi:hypothetical protein